MSIDSSKHHSLAKELLPAPQHLIDGEWSTSATGGSRPHVNPSTGDVQATIPMSGESEVDDAVAAAKGAAGPWRDLPPHERYSLLAALGGGIVIVALAVLRGHGFAKSVGLGLRTIGDRRGGDLRRHRCGRGLGWRSWLRAMSWWGCFRNAITRARSSSRGNHPNQRRCRRSFRCR